MQAQQTRLPEFRNVETPWKKRGLYLSKRQWGMARGDYSEDGNAWNYFSHDPAGVFWGVLRERTSLPATLKHAME